MKFETGYSQVPNKREIIWKCSKRGEDGGLNKQGSLKISFWKHKEGPKIN